MGNFFSSAYAKFGQPNPQATKWRSGGSVRRDYRDEKEQETVESVLASTKILKVPQQNIGLDAAKYFGIRSAVSEENGVDVVATYFPYRDKYGNLTGYKKRDWTIPKEQKGHWSVVSVVKANSQFFGQKMVGEGSDHRKIIVCEGEGDVIAAWQTEWMMVKKIATDPSSNKKAKAWAQSVLDGIKSVQDGGSAKGFPTINVVGLNCGCANAVDAFANNEKFIRGFDEIVLAFDNDAANDVEKLKHVTKGVEATHNVAAFLMADNVYHVQYPSEVNDPEGYKDIRDLFQAKKFEQIHDMFKNPIKYVPDAVAGLSDFSIEDLRKKSTNGVNIGAEFPKLQKMLKGLHKGTLVMLTGPSGCLSCDHEILTPTGWVRIDSWAGEPILQYDKDSGEARFIVPQQYHMLPCDKLTRIVARGVDQEVSDEHTMLVVGQTHGKWREPRTISAERLIRRYNESVKGIHEGFITTFRFDGEGIDMTEGELRLQVAVMADGHIVKNGANNYTTMVFNKERKYKRLLELCETHDLKYVVHKDSPQAEVKGKYKVVVWPKTDEKHFSSRYYQCSKEQLGIIIEEVRHWDATIRGDDGFDYFSTCKEDVDFIQFAAAACGYKTSVKVRELADNNHHTLWLIRCRRGAFSQEVDRLGLRSLSSDKNNKKNFVAFTPKDGMKYCFTTDTGFFITRLNGCIAVTGNSGKTTVTKKIEYQIAKYLMDPTVAKADDYDPEDRLCMIHLEEDPEEAINSLYANQLGYDIKNFMEDPSKYLTEQEHFDIHKAWVDADKIRVFRHFGSIPVNDLITKLKQMVCLYHCRYIVLDHLSMVISGLNVKDERKELDLAMTQLAAFCKQFNVFILVIAHLRRTEIIPPKDKEGRALPFWYPVRKENLRGCLPAETEFLSQHGWKRMDEWKEGDLVYQVNDDGVGCFTEPERYFKLPCEYMWQLSNNRLTMTTSEEHNVVYNDYRTRKFLTIPMEELVRKHVTNKQGFKGLIPTTFSSACVGTLGLTDDELRLQVAVNADGWMLQRKQVVGVCAVRVKKQRKIDRMRILLQRAGYHYTEFSLHGVHEGKIEFRFKAPLLSKGVTTEWFNLNQHELQIICDELLFWDCDVNTGRFSSINKLEADFVQFVYHACGYQAPLSEGVNKGFVDKDGKPYANHTIYKVGKNKATRISFQKAPKSKPECEMVQTSDGFKYCFTVPTHKFIAREKGKVFITGNSGSMEQLSWVVIGVEAEEMPDRSRGRVRLVSLKNRPAKTLGIADVLIMDPETGKFSDASDWVWDKETGFFLNKDGDIVWRPQDMFDNEEHVVVETPEGKVTAEVKPQPKPVDTEGEEEDNGGDDQSVVQQEFPEDEDCPF